MLHFPLWLSWWAAGGGSACVGLVLCTRLLITSSIAGNSSSKVKSGSFWLVLLCFAATSWASALQPVTYWKVNGFPFCWGTGCDLDTKKFKSHLKLVSAGLNKPTSFFLFPLPTFRRSLLKPHHGKQHWEAEVLLDVEMRLNAENNIPFSLLFRKSTDGNSGYKHQLFPIYFTYPS